MEKLQFTKLNGTNYQIWKFKMQMLLTDKEVWETISEPRPAAPNAEWLKKDGKAFARIGLMVDDNQLCHIRKEESAAGAWNALKKHHEKSTLTNKIFLLKRLCRMQMSTNGNMEEHIHSLLDLVNQLEALGENLGEHLVVALMLCSLPDNYNPLITALESRDEKDLTLEMVKGKLINEYKRINGSEAESFSSNESALKITNGNEYTKFNCHFCNKRGHFQRDCFLFKQSLGSEEDEMEQKSKSKQKWETHKAKKVVECYSSESENEEIRKYKCFMAKTVLPKSPKGMRCTNDWYIDSAVTIHMTHNLKFFKNIKMGTNRPVELANGKVIFAAGIGEGFVNCPNEKGEILQILMRNVLYVPELDANLLSVRKLTELGFKVNFDGNECYIREDGTIIAVGSVDQNNLYRLHIKENLTHNLKFFKNIKMGTNRPVELANGKVIFAAGIGEGFVNCPNEKGEILQILMRNVLYVPELDANLLSVRKLTELGFKVNFDGNECYIREDGTIIAVGSVDQNNLYRLHIKENLWKNKRRNRGTIKTQIKHSNTNGMKKKAVIKKPSELKENHKLQTCSVNMKYKNRNSKEIAHGRQAKISEQQATKIQLGNHDIKFYDFQYLKRPMKIKLKRTTNVTNHSNTGRAKFNNGRPFTKSILAELSKI